MLAIQQILLNIIIRKPKYSEAAALLVDISKAFDCIVHDLVLAKLGAYGFDYNSQN